MSKRTYNVFGKTINDYGSGMGTTKRRRTGAIGANARFARTVARVTGGLQRQPLYRAAAASSLRRAVANAKESGYVDAAGTFNFDTTGSIVLLATIAQGASVNQRIGKKALFKSVQCRGYIANGIAATTNDCAFLVVYDKRPTGALPAITDILVTADSRAMNNDANSGRFSVLKRWDGMLIGPVTGTIATQQLTECSAISGDFYLDLKQKETVFKAAGTGAIGDIEQGALYFISVGEKVAGTTAAAALFNFRVRFHDC